MTSLQRPGWPLSAGVAAIAIVAGLSCFGDTPDTRDTSPMVAAWFSHHRTGVFAGVVLVGVAMMAVLTLGARLAERFSNAGEPVLGRVIQGASTVSAAVVMIGALLPYAGLAYVLGQESPEMAKGIFDLTLVTTPILALALSVMVGATGLAAHRSYRFGPWFAWLSLGVAVTMLWSACSFAARGPMSPDVQQSVVFELLVLWVVAAGIAEGRCANRLRRQAPSTTLSEDCSVAVALESRTTQP